jgi:hypothetical protein
MLEPGYNLINYVLVSEGMLPHITSIGMLSQDTLFAIDHRYFVMDLNDESYFGHETDAVPAKKLPQLQLDDPIIEDEYIQQLHRLFACHNGYIRVKSILEWSILGIWSIEDEGEYEKIGQYIWKDKKRKGERNHFDLVLNCYLIKSKVDNEAHDKTPYMQYCIRQLNFSRQIMEDVIANAK